MLWNNHAVLAIEILCIFNMKRRNKRKDQHATRIKRKNHSRLFHIRHFDRVDPETYRLSSAEETAENALIGC